MNKLMKLKFCLACLGFSAAVFGETKVMAEKLTPSETLLPMLLGLAGILGVIFILALLVKKITGLNLVSNNIKVIESQSLGAKEKLVIVEIQEQQYVLGVTAQSINQICQLENKIEKKSSNVSFDKMMKQFLNPASILTNNDSVKKSDGQASNKPVDKTTDVSEIKK